MIGWREFGGEQGMRRCKGYVQDAQGGDGGGKRTWQQRRQGLQKRGAGTRGCEEMMQGTSGGDKGLECKGTSGGDKGLECGVWVRNATAGAAEGMDSSAAEGMDSRWRRGYGLQVPRWHELGRTAARPAQRKQSHAARRAVLGHAAHGNRAWIEQAGVTGG
eukprot:CAMPEP_0196651760 /NCGR_PEP_ID=MMETSP1086-20130531/854_1 /TAXON_ID=77921 /ORGANISM="Cyanoptyche  gloeocystis , Strain SAG4.97" /LENGTH=160 /DNA_ID=CAMNT_0041981933 /DNA_START=170 /DNA_END=651 /DNA_ORIENTATION=-